MRDLTTVDLTFIGPFTNVVAFICTLLVSRLLGEQQLSTSTAAAIVQLAYRSVAYVGMAFVVTGIAVANSS